MYLDTSILAAYYCPESLSAQAESLIRRNSTRTISVLTEVELVSAVARKIREKGLSSNAGQKIILQFNTHLKDNLYRMLLVQTEHYALAKHWISQCSSTLRTLDALHLAIAYHHGLTLLTADHGLAKAAKHFGVTAQTVG